MSKTLVGLVAALLVAGAALFVLRQRDSASDVSSAYPDRNFAVSDPRLIGLVEIADMRGRRLALVRRGEAWYIDDSLRASPSIMAEVLRVLTEVSVDFIPPAATVAAVERDMRTNALRIAVFDRAGEPLRSLLLGPSTPDERNSYMLVEGQRQPYAVRVPGHTGSLRPLFDLRSVDAWRSLDFVDLEPEEITGIRVEYPRSRGAGFVIERGPEQLDLRPADPLVAPPSGDVRQRLLESYLEGYADVALVGRSDGWAGADSLRATEPHARITVGLAGGDSTVLRLYPRYLTRPDGSPSTGEPVPSYYVDRDGRELARVQTLQLQQWLRDYAYFQR